MINYDKVPLSTEQLSRIRVLFASPDFQLFRKCVEHEIQSLHFDATALLHAAEAFDSKANHDKKTGQAKVKQEDARRLGAFLHILDNYASKNELFNIVINHN